MKNKLVTLKRDIFNSSWRLRLFIIGLPFFMLLASETIGQFGPRIPELKVDFLTLGGGTMSELLTALIFAGLLFVWLTDSRRRYRLNRDSIYFGVILTALLLGSLVDTLINRRPLYSYEQLPNGGFSAELNGIFFVLYLIAGYIVLWPLMRYQESRSKSVKGIESKKIFK